MPVFGVAQENTRACQKGARAQPAIMSQAMHSRTPRRTSPINAFASYSSAPSGAPGSELELAFACMVRKTVRFYDSSGLIAPAGSRIPVTETLALQIVTRVPYMCAAEAASGMVRNRALRHLAPRWVRRPRAGRPGWRVWVVGRPLPDRARGLPPADSGSRAPPHALRPDPVYNPLRIRGMMNIISWGRTHGARQGESPEE